MKIKSMCLLTSLSFIHAAAVANTADTSSGSLHHFEADLTGQFLGKKKDETSNQQISSMKQWAIDLDYSYDATSKLNLSFNTHYQRDNIRSSYLTSHDVRSNSAGVGVRYHVAPTWYIKTVANVSHQYLADAVSMSDSRTYDAGILALKEHKIFGLDMVAGLGLGYSHNTVNSEWDLLFDADITINEQWHLGFQNNGLSTGGINISYKPVDYLTLDLAFGGMGSTFFIAENEVMTIEHQMVGLAAKWKVNENLNFRVGTNYLFDGEIETDSKGGEETTLTKDLDNRMSYYVSVGISF
tara:strand:+ start:3629 stop:4519 length:891 start_codon:yes stop_codon:yes gene_type:complete